METGYCLMELEEKKKLASGKQLITHSAKLFQKEWGPPWVPHLRVVFSGNSTVYSSFSKYSLWGFFSHHRGEYRYA